MRCAHAMWRKKDGSSVAVVVVCCALCLPCGADVFVVRVGAMGLVRTRPFFGGRAYRVQGGRAPDLVSGFRHRRALLCGDGWTRKSWMPFFSSLCLGDVLGREWLRGRCIVTGSPDGVALALRILSQKVQGGGEECLPTEHHGWDPHPTTDRGPMALTLLSGTATPDQGLPAPPVSLTCTRYPVPEWDVATGS